MIKKTKEEILRIKEERKAKKIAKEEEKEKLSKMTKEEIKEYKKEKKNANANDAVKYTKGFFQGFKNFISKGNVLDMAVGVVMGTAFTAIVNALVNGILLQFISLLTGNADFTDIVWSIPNGQTEVVVDPVTQVETVVNLTTDIKFGVFIQAIINFLLIAFVLYLVVNVLIKRQVRRDLEAQAEAEKKAKEDEIAKKLAEEEQENAPLVVSEDIELLKEIRDLLKRDK
ncbi:large conductance mechanosensitive channel protein MscL [Acholeplasma sp. OttesenSCG-928-E16]|nr:large conductance mechanosensitive channel protein MscL [Acholeplasma sp. OttesenSCG-928-E16]